MSFFITAGSGGGYKSGSSYNNSNAMLNQMTNAVASPKLQPPAAESKTRFKGRSATALTSVNNRAAQPAAASSTRTFRVDPFDYQPIRVGIRHAYKAIVIDYELKSTGKRYLHNIKVGKFTDPMAFGISVSRSGSFAEALLNEVNRIVDRVYAEHCEYLPPERIQRKQIEGLVNDILVFNQTKRKESLKDWNEVQHPERRSSLKDRSNS